MRRLGLLSALTIACALLGPDSAQGQEPNSWIGKRVVLPFNSVLRVGNEVVDDQNREANGRGGLRISFRVYTVEQINGPWLWIKADRESIAGYILATEVIFYEQAIEYVTNQIRKNPNNDSAYIWRGHLWKDKKEYDLALGDYNEAIRLDPTSEVAYSSRGNAWFDKGEFDKAITDYNEALRIDPKLAPAYVNRGIVWRQKGEFDKAITDYNEALRIDPKLASAYSNRGTAWFDKGELDKAIADYTAVIQIDPKGLNASYAVIRGYLASRMARNDRAADEFLGSHAKQLGTTAWPSPVVRWLRGEIDVAKLLELAVDTDKKTEVHCYLGLRDESENRRDAALVHFHWVKNHGTKSFVEYDTAVVELARLEAAANVDRSP